MMENKSMLAPLAAWRSAQRVPIVVLGAIILALSAFHLTSHAQTKPKRDFGTTIEVQYYRNSSQDIVKLRIPEGYIDRSVVGQRLDGIQNRLYFETFGAELLPQTDSNQALFIYPASLRNIINFNVDSLYRLRPGQINARTQSYYRTLSEMLRTPCKWNYLVQDIYGLRHEAIDPTSCPEIPPQSREDRYQLRSRDGDIMTLIRCSPVDLREPDPRLIDGVTPTPVPRCEHRFPARALNSWVELRYDREFLPHWRELEQAVTKRLESFVVPN